MDAVTFWVSRNQLQEHVRHLRGAIGRHGLRRDAFLAGSDGEAVGACLQGQCGVNELSKVYFLLRELKTN